MEEFPDELIAKYTRKELEAMAIDLEITTVGLSTKAQLAEAIFDAKRKMEVKSHQRRLQRRFRQRRLHGQSHQRRLQRRFRQRR